jgi:serine phosphatase RsbU (regulator of sigma subunit)
MAGLKSVLAGSRGRCAREILEDVLGAVGAHAGGHAQSDDMTLVVMRRL